MAMQSRVNTLEDSIMQATLTWADLRRFGKTDSAGRWYPRADIAEYFAHLRAPSRAWPHSYARAAMTKRFARYLAERGLA